MFAGTNHRPEAVQRVSLGAQRDGTLIAIGHDAWMHSTFHDEVR